MAIARAQMLLGEERKRKIVQLVESEGRVTVADLVKRFGLSEVTVRSDLEGLASTGALLRVHGGAIKPEDPTHDPPIKFRETLHHAEKVRIAQAAAALIRPEQTIILDSGTTTLEIARQITGRSVKPLAVITNALPIATEMCSVPQTTVIMLGGILRPMSYSLVGPQAEHEISKLNAHHLFLGVAGVDLEMGLSTPDILEAQLNAAMIRVAREVTVVSDSSKFGQRSLSVISQMDMIHRVITDDLVDQAMVASLRNRGIEVVVV
jgi:DeoR family transcriptional regulator, aga operon transcriptional repressor